MHWDREAVAEEEAQKTKSQARKDGMESDRNMLFKGGFEDIDEESRGLMSPSNSNINNINTTELVSQSIGGPDISEAKKKKNVGMSANDLKSDGNSSQPEHSDEESSAKSFKIE